jgi:catechol 1,2-dioxygenase
MATDFTEETAADAVIDSFAGTPDERLREILTSLVQHLHGFVRVEDPAEAARYGAGRPFRHADFEIVLQPG